MSYRKHANIIYSATEYDDWQYSIEILENIGYTYVGHGWQRTIFTLPDDEDRVIKFPNQIAWEYWEVEGEWHDGKGHSHNQIESSNWEWVEDNHDDPWPFLPVFDHDEDGWYLIMPRVTPEPEWGDIKKVREAIKEMDVDMRMRDVRTRNIGRWKDRPYLYDYGDDSVSQQISISDYEKT